jgi:excisionase family DNA binding protein
MNKLKDTNKSNKQDKHATRSFLTTGQAAIHCQVTIPTLTRWIREGKLAAFKTPGGHVRIDRGEFQRFLRQYGMPAYPLPSPEARILIVDDDPHIVDLLAGYLADDPRGFKLETATDGYVALIKVGDFKPSLLILDAAMPQVDGIEVCRRLKATPETRPIKILGVTGYPERVPELLEAGADACLSKPVDLPLVKQELERLLGLSPEAPRPRKTKEMPANRR